MSFLLRIYGSSGIWTFGIQRDSCWSEGSQGQEGRLRGVEPTFHVILFVNPAPRIALFVRPSRFLPHLRHTIVWCVSVPDGMEVDKVINEVTDEVADEVADKVGNEVTDEVVDK